MEARRAALKIVADLTAAELSRSAHNPRAEWTAWTDGFFYEKYQDSPKSLLRYQNCWKQMKKFLEDRKINFPSQVRYQHALDYMSWRKADGTHHNTARLEVVILGMVMQEAVRRGFITANPIVKTGIVKMKSPERPELTDADIDAIRTALLAEEEWMRVAFEIALHTGCRLNETRIDFANIDLEKRIVTYRAPKGGDIRAFTAKFRTELVPILERIKATGAKYTLEFPQETNAYPDVTTNHWSRFFAQLRKTGTLSDPNISFHSTRVTFVTRHVRARTDERIVKKLVNHSSTLVHRIYSRLRAEDVTDQELQIPLPPPRDACPANPGPS